ncbi:uncharacterized protein LOC134662630 [Cydia amplana]|uniref:uncharacterized protein LOC134662630 n=1 Tax=Cydia amplana TaxID=1869771 RepID=UPI002FE50431
MSNFWQTEKVPEIYAEHTSEQQQCEKLFTETVKLEDNQFTVSLPLKIPIYDVNNTLGDSFGLALKRFYNLEKRFQKDQNLYEGYKDFIHEYLDLGHGSYVDISSYELTKDPVYFMGHSAVLRPDAVSTKLRVVFDGSMLTSNKISLNNILMNGPTVQQELFDILLSFRVHKYFIACDIRRMFRNILVQKDQRSLQNILWRDTPNESIKCIQLNTVCYGMKSSSYLSTRCLNELATKFERQYPLASSAILNSTYVDDIIHTENSLAKIVDTQTQLIELLAKGSFKLHKWAANDPSILANIPVEQQVVGELELNKDIKTLGLKLDIDSDSFKLSCPVSKNVPKTKRQILSYISQFYDPLGLAGPVFVQAKIIMQKLAQSYLNPSDCLSRGVKPSELQGNQLWWCGPTSMSDPEYKFTDVSNDNVPDNLPEIKHASRPAPPQLCAPEWSPVLTRLYRLSLQTRTMPKSWKLANVQPVPKKGSRADPCNYRPIAITSMLCKVMESVLNGKLLTYLEEKDLFSDRQYGFRRGRSTLAYVTHCCGEAIERNGEELAVSLDISKAFDRVWHASLLSKIPAYGIPADFCSWLSDFLSDRSIRVVIDGCSSDLMAIDAGVPQGSVLSATLFLLHINDMLQPSC